MISTAGDLSEILQKCAPGDCLCVVAEAVRHFIMGLVLKACRALASINGRISARGGETGIGSALSMARLEEGGSRNP